MSRHHWNIVSVFARSPNESRMLELWWNHTTKPDVSKRAERAPVRGHGLGLTMWNGWIWCVIMCCHVDIGLQAG